jgi:hypothetical protein
MPHFSRLRAIAEADGRVRAIVGLRVAFTPEGALSAARREVQHGAIVEATDDVRRALRGTPHRVIHTYRLVPYVAVELSRAALDRLDANGVVASTRTSPGRPRWRRAPGSWNPRRPRQSAAPATAMRWGCSTPASTRPIPS